MLLQIQSKAHTVKKNEQENLKATSKFLKVLQISTFLHPVACWDDC